MKGGPEFLLYKLTTPASSGTWSRFGLRSGGGNQPEISHIRFCGTQGIVPEASVWALLIAGLGLVGAAMRRRREGVGTVRARHARGMRGTLPGTAGPLAFRTLGG